MSLTVQQLLNDAKRLTSRLRDHDDAANRVVSNAQDTFKSVTEMRTYQEDIETLNAIAHNRPRAQLVLGIQQENRHIRQLQQENKELRAALEEHQNAIELIMSKYRQHMMCLVNSTKFDRNALKNQKARLLQDRVDKICEMANVMSHSIQMDEEGQAHEQEVMSRLITENKGLREMLEISFKNGSYSDPLVGPKVTSRECQTDEDFSSKATSVSNSNCDLSNDNRITSTAASDKSGNGVPFVAAECKHCHAASGDVNSSSMVNSNSNSSIRPVSVASMSSESSESSTSEDDEITFNTIKRQTNYKAANGGNGVSNEAEDKVIVSIKQDPHEVNGVNLDEINDNNTNGDSACTNPAKEPGS